MTEEEKLKLIGETWQFIVHAERYFRDHAFSKALDNLNSAKEKLERLV